jgi:hypothetical protein
MFLEAARRRFLVRTSWQAAEKLAAVLVSTAKQSRIAANAAVQGSLENRLSLKILRSLAGLLRCARNDMFSAAGQWF